MMNNEYYILEGEEKKGPYTYNDLINMDITIYTELITPQSDVPQYASELSEFNDYFEAQGIYFPTQDNLAGYGKRVSAFIIDYFGTYILVSNIATRSGWVVLPTTYRLGMEVPASMLMLTLSVLSTFLLYNAICEATPLKASLGKKIFKLIVVDINGQGQSIFRALLRNLGVILSITIWIPFLSVFFSEHRQAWYDSLAKTYVITTQQG